MFELFKKNTRRTRKMQKDLEVDMKKYLKKEGLLQDNQKIEFEWK